MMRLIHLLLSFHFGALCMADSKSALGASATTLRVEISEKVPASLAVVFSDEGYLLTKASEIGPSTKVQLVLREGARVKAREVRRDLNLDLVLLHVDQPHGLKAPTWNESKSLGLGQWLMAPQGGEQIMRAGVVSARRRAISSSGSAIGIQTDPTKLDHGVRIDFVIPDSPAAAAGLKADDVVLSVAGELIDKGQGLRDLISRKTPGDEVEILYRRSGKESKCLVRVASRVRIEAKLSDDDYANGGVSLRSDRFPEIIQHDIPLAPTDMGGPLLNLQGQAVGINIARVDRVTTFALPTEIFLPEVEKWIREDKARVSSGKP